MDILGIKIDNLNRKEILDRTNALLQEEEFHQIATVNPEFILKAQEDEEFKGILNSCSLNVADGIGIWFAFLRFGNFLKSRFAGADLVEEILRVASSNRYSIFLAASQTGMSTWEETRDAILKKYPTLQISGANMDKDIQQYLLPDVDILLCNFGAPHQEKFIYSLKNSRNAKVRLAMGVGGSFDFLTGKIRRAPKFMRSVGMEWLWRFLQEPKYRAKRIWKAVIVFPIKILLNNN